jgi:nucleoside-diphosphate-sugar epimerase
MSTILITGANGFLGREFTEYFSQTPHDVIAAPRQILDLTDSEQVDAFFASRAVDIVLHTAARPDESFDSLRANLSMFHNLKKHAADYKLMFSFGSGAEFDRYSNVNQAAEEDIYTSIPTDYYGLAKNLIAREIILHNNNIINLRLFGCFGIMEKNTRFIKNSLGRIKKGLPIFIFQDRLMDFFYVGDLIKVVEHLMTKSKGHHVDYNMCYPQETTLAIVAEQLNALAKSPTGIVVEKRGYAYSYTGSSTRLESLGLVFTGLEAGIKEVVGSEQNV